MSSFVRINGIPISSNGATVAPVLTGPGAELKKLLARFRILPRSCGCDVMASRMNQGGPNWCRAHFEEIVNVMEKEARKRRVPFFRFAAVALVKLAIHLAERKDIQTI